MKEYFIISNSFAAPFFSDQGTHYVKGKSPESALKKLAKDYSHPCGLFAAAVYESADDYHKNKTPLAKWICNQEAEKQRLTKDLGCYSYLGIGPGVFEIDGKRHTVSNPKEGRVYSA